MNVRRRLKHNSNLIFLLRVTLDRNSSLETDFGIIRKSVHVDIFELTFVITSRSMIMEKRCEDCCSLANRCAGSGKPFHKVWLAQRDGVNDERSIWDSP